MPLIQIKGYAPDLDPTEPGVLTDCSNLLPSVKGMEAAKTAVDAGFPPLGDTAAGSGSACRGAAILKELDNTTRFIAGTATKLWEGSSNVWTDRTRASGNYNLTGEQRWRFAQFGNVTLAASKADVIQASTSGAFSNVSASPAIKAAIIETVDQFVFAFDTSDTAFGDSPDRWWCSAIGDYTNWTPSLAAQSVSGRLQGTPGKITAARRFGNQIVAYKSDSAYVANYVGPPLVWDWIQLPGEIGTPCNEAVVSIGTTENPAHVFVGDGDFYIFDGSRAREMRANVRNAFFAQLHRSRAGTIDSLHDKTNSRVFFFYPTTDTTYPDSCVVYNYRSGRWGRANMQIEAAISFTTPGITYDQMGSSYATYHSMPNSDYDSAFASSTTPVPGVFNTAHKLVTLTGTPASSSLTTGDYGDDAIFQMVSRLRPRFVTKPTSANLTNYYRNNLGDSLAPDSGALLDDSRFDFLREARWHRFLMQFSGPMEIIGWNIYSITGGDE